MKRADVEPVAFRLRLDGRPALAELLEWTAEYRPSALKYMDYNAGKVFPELWYDWEHKNSFPADTYNKWVTRVPLSLWKAACIEREKARALRASKR